MCRSADGLPLGLWQDNRDVEGSGVRMTELLAALSFGADLGLGHPTEHVLRQTHIALHLAERLGMDEGEREVVYYASMLAWLGCHVDAYEQAKWFGDDQTFKHEAAYVDDGDILGTVGFLLRHIGDGRPLGERVKAGVGFLADGRHDLGHMYETTGAPPPRSVTILGSPMPSGTASRRLLSVGMARASPRASKARNCCSRPVWSISRMSPRCSTTPVA